MALPERIAELDRQIAAAVERAVAGVRAELQGRLDRLSDELKRSLAEELPPANLPATFLAAGDIEPLTSEAASRAAQSAREESLADLRDAVAAIDRARQQGDILRALLAGARQHASRVALFLVSPDGVRGWSAQGFADDARLADLSVTWYEDEAWLELRQGLGSVELTAADCSRLLARAEDSLPLGGALLPLVLRDRVAAAIYADRMDEHASWSLPALQTLTWSAALALETLPFRQRSSTPTLRSLADAEGEGGLALWDPQAVVEAEPEPVAVAAEVSEIEAEIVDDLVSSPSDAVREAVSWEAEPLPEVTAPAGFAFDEPLYVEVEPPAPVVEVPAAEEPAEIAGEWMYEEAPLPEPPPPAPPPEPAATVAFEAWRPEPAPAPVPQAEPPVDFEAPELPPLAPPVTREEPRPSALDMSEDDTYLLSREARTAAPPPPPSPVAEPAPAPAASATQEMPSVDEDVTHPGIAPSPAVTAAVPQPAKWQSGGSTEVAPPPDLQGPGWALATTRVPTVQAAPTEDASHDEARRLARLLVSEIKLYNEEQVEDGRRNRDIYERLKEDIDRSRQMYEERVEERIRNTTDYFYQELVRILAGGDPRAMGI
jgi:hypothetical protein